MGLTTVSLAFSLLAPSIGVKFDEPAQTLEQLMPKLSEWTGQKLTVGSLMAKDVVLVRVMGADYNEVLAKLVKTVGGIWTKTSDGLRLDRDMQLEAKEILDANRERAEYLKAEIAKLVVEFNKQPTFDPAKLRENAEAMIGQFQQGQQGQPSQPGQPRQPGGRGMQGMMGMQNSMPGGRAIIQTLSAMRPDELARIVIGQRVVYSSLPTPMQKPLPGNAINIMRAFVADQVKLGAQMGRGRNRGQGQQVQNEQPPASQQVPVPVKSFLIVTRNGFNQGLNFNYVVADNTGAAIGTGNLNLGQDGFRGNQAAQSGGAKSEDAIKLTPLGQASAQALGRTGGPGGRGGFGGQQDQAQVQSPELAKLLRDPVANDPLSLHVSEVLKAASGEKNFIALLPDSFAGSVSQLVRGSVSPDQVITISKDTWKMEVEQTDTWLTIAPLRRYDSRIQRVDRVALKTLLDSIAKKGSVRLDDLAIYATKAPSSGQGGIDAAVVRLLDPASAQAIAQVYSDDREMLVMYAAMGASTRANLARGQKQAVNSVSTNSFGLLASIVFNSQGGPTVAGQNGQANVNQGTEVIARSAAQTGQVPLTLAAPAQQQGRQQGRGGGPGQGFRGGNQNMSVERTEILPRGVPANAIVSMNLRAEPVVKAVNSGSGLARVFSAQMMAGDRARAEMPAPQGGNQPQRPTISWDGYVSGVRSSYTFLFELASGISLVRQLEDTSFDANAKPVAFNQLPAEFQKSVDSRYQQMKEEMTRRSQDPQQRGQRGGGRRGASPGQIPPGP